VYRTKQFSLGCWICRACGQRFALTHRRLDKLRLPTTPQNPNSNEGILFLAGMKEKSREGFKVGGATILRRGRVGKSPKLLPPQHRKFNLYCPMLPMPLGFGGRYQALLRAVV